jgi:TPR repeat protein
MTYTSSTINNFRINSTTLALHVGVFIGLCLFAIFNVHADGLFDFQMKLADRGNAEAQFKVGEMYETGFGVAKDQAAAETWINKAAKQGHETASFKLLFWDMRKHGITPDNKIKFDELKKKAAAENPMAEYYLGKHYAEGFGVPKSLDQALEWFNKATLLGVVEAEREAITVRDAVQREQLAQRREEEKRKAELKAREEEERLKQEAEREAELKKKQEVELAAKQAEERRKQEEATKKAAASSEKVRQQAEAKERDVKRQSILEQREADEKARKAEFESDPCSGKSARFLSTCR